MRIFPELAVVAVIAGAGLALWSDISLGSAWPLLLLGLGALALAVALKVIGLPAAPVALSAALILGVWRAELVADASIPLAPDGPTEVTVIVSDAPTLSGSRVRFRGEVVANPTQQRGSVPVGTGLLVYALPPPDLAAKRPPPHLRYGDTLRLSGSLERPEPIGDFDYAAWLEAQGIAGVLWARQADTVSTDGGNWVMAALHQFRGHLAAALQRAMPPPESGLAQALLLGIRTELPAEVKDAFRTAGMSHLLAISGLHVGIVLALALGIGSATLGSGNPLVIFGAMATVWIYAVVSGLDPPVVRAAIMGSLALAQGLTGRGMRGLTALTLAAGLMICADPTLLTSLSFQLSFTAMAGVIVGLPLITLFSGAVATLAGSSNAGAWRWLQYGADVADRLCRYFHYHHAGNGSADRNAFRGDSGDECAGNHSGNAGHAPGVGGRCRYCHSRRRRPVVGASVGRVGLGSGCVDHSGSGGDAAGAGSGRLGDAGGCRGMVRRPDNIDASDVVAAGAPVRCRMETRTKVASQRIRRVPVRSGAGCCFGCHPAARPTVDNTGGWSASRIRAWTWDRVTPSCW